MLNLYFKGGLSGISEGTMITVKSEDQNDIYEALKNSGCSELIAKTGKYRSLWETAQERDKRMAKERERQMGKQAVSKSGNTKSHETPPTTSSDFTMDKCNGGDEGDDTALKAVYLEIKKPEVKKELAKIAKRREEIASNTSISAAERLKETLNCIVQAYHSQNSVIVDYHAQHDLERKTISEIKQVIRQTSIPDEADELTDFIKYVKSGAIKPKKKVGIFDMADKILNFVFGGGDEEDDYTMDNEDKLIGNLLYQKLQEIAEVKPEHPLIIPLIKKKQLKKQIIIECVGIIIVYFLSIIWLYDFFLGLGISAAGCLVNVFTKVDEKYPIQIRSLKLPIPTHALVTIVLNIIIAYVTY